jgi:hypothetical protein
MFDASSRYAALPDTIYTAPGGQQIVYKARRFLPQGKRIPLLSEAVVGTGDRLDLIAARTLGDAEQFWQICDANDALNPWDLVGETGRRVRIPLPQFAVAR